MRHAAQCAGRGLRGKTDYGLMVFADRVRGSCVLTSFYFLVDFSAMVERTNATSCLDGFRRISRRQQWTSLSRKQGLLLVNGFEIWPSLLQWKASAVSRCWQRKCWSRWVSLMSIDRSFIASGRPTSREIQTCHARSSLNTIRILVVVMLLRLLDYKQNSCLRIVSLVWRVYGTGIIMEV